MADGLILAAKRGNARGAKEPCCSVTSQTKWEAGATWKKSVQHSARPETEAIPQGEGPEGGNRWSRSGQITLATKARPTRKVT